MCYGRRDRVCVGSAGPTDDDLLYHTLIRDGDGAYSWQPVGDDDPYQISRRDLREP
jgi:hypothetical protein